MTWVQKLLDDESVFPSKIGVPFPRNFHSVTKQIFKRLFRVYAHIYHAHFKVVVHELGEEAHLNTSFKHFIYFVQVRSLQYFITTQSLPMVAVSAVYATIGATVHSTPLSAFVFRGKCLLLV
jgi:hypothetical protein